MLDFNLKVYTVKRYKMKTIKYVKIASVLLFVMAISFSCVKTEFDEPDFSELASVKSPIEANTTIKEVVGKYNGGVYKSIEGSTFIRLIDGAEYISAIVTANDKSGNLYKTIYISDENTGESLAVAIESTGLSFDYPVGQRLVINLKGLLLDQFGIMKLGGSTYDSKGKLRLGGIPSVLLNKIIYADGNPIEVKPVEVSLTDLANPSTQKQYLGRLVKINEVQFSDADVNSSNPYYYDKNNEIGGASNRNIQNKLGETLIVRNSSYAKFSSNKLPEGSGSLIAIFSAYGSEMQLLLRDINDVNMTEPRFTVSGSFNGFVNYSVLGDEVWSYDSKYKCFKMTGYNGSRKPNEDWFISPVIDLSSSVNPTFKFRHALGYGNYSTVWDDLKVFVSDNYTESSDPTTATWTEISFAKPADLSAKFVWTESGEIELADFKGKPNVHIAFRYKNDVTNCSTWELDKLVLNVD